MALDKFQPYLFVSAGEQSNKYLTPTYADGIAKFQAQRAQQVNKLLVQIDPVQDLNGQSDPYPPGGGKNKLENTAQTATQSGVTFTVNEDGTVSTSGTSTEDANYIVLGVMTLPAGDYVLSGCPSGGSASTFYIIINSGSTASSEEGVRVATDIGSGAEFTLSEATEICVWMACDNGQVMNNKVFKPMIRLASVTDGTYAPYSNICPISGRTGMTVTRAGKNLLNPALTYGLLSLTIGALETDITQSTRYGYTERFPSTSDIVLSMRSTDTTMCEYARIAQYVDGVLVALSQQINFANTSTWYTRTLTGIPNSYCRLIIGSVVNDCGTEIQGEAQVEVGSAQTAYKPYVGTTYPISWQTQAGTVYGGTLDVVSGVLTVDKGFYTITDADYPTLFQAGTNANRVGTSVAGSKTSPTEADRLNIISNIAKADVSILTASQQALGQCCLYSGAGATNSIALFGVPTTEDTASKAIQWLVAQGCTFVYPLATPQTYQLTPTEVRTIAGYNQIYADTGAVLDVEF